MKSVLDRYRELSGIVESRPAYNIVLDEETETKLQAEIDGLIVERKDLEAQLEAKGLLEHYLQLKQTPELGAKAARMASLRKSQVAKSHTIHKKLSGLNQPKRPSASFLDTHQSGPASGLQRGDTHEKLVSVAGREDRKRRMHAHAAFHHFHAAQAYKALGSEKKAESHLAAAEAHHVRAKAPKGEQGDYMVNPKTGKHTDYTPVYDKKGEKARKNKVSKKARVAAKKVWRSGAPVRADLPKADAEAA